jgi:hypothetical protein
MATRQEAREHIIDLILDFTITNAVSGSGEGIDLSSYRRYINPTTGQITVDENAPTDSSLVLYETDFRESFSESLIGDSGTGVVNDIIDNCVDLDADALSTIVSDLWSYVPGGTTCTDFSDGVVDSGFGGISFNGPAATNLGGNDCAQLHGTMGGGVIDTQIILPLTDEVLASLSQFITITQQQTDINEGLAEDILDTNIYELLPGGQTVQEQISKFFADYNRLKGSPPPIVPDTDDPTTQLPGFIDDDGDGTADSWSSTADETTYTDAHDVSDDGLTGNISRLVGDAPAGFDNQTLEWLRNDLNTFLYDIDYDPVTAETDSRPDYENQSGGYLKFRGLNQGIIIRSTEGTDVGLIGSDPGNPVWRTQGFTITMWARFLDKVSSGTLFNFGNPLRTDNPDGFMLETFIDDSDTDNRYIRLVLRDVDSNNDGILDLRDSHVGNADRVRYDTATNNQTAYDSNTDYLENYTSVPIDFSEWYFIVASFNPAVTEDTGSFDQNFGTCYNSICNQDEDFWRNNIDANGYTVNSELGAMCKVEVISKSDLLRARGYGV